MAYKKVHCVSCGKVIAKGNIPAPVEIKCGNCGVLNDLSQGSKTIPFGERVQLEKKGGPILGKAGPELIIPVGLLPNSELKIDFSNTNNRRRRI